MRGERRAAGGTGQRVHAVDLAAQVVERLAPEAEDVRLLAADGERLVGLAADRDRDAVAVRREARPEVVEPEELAVVAEGGRLGPRAAQQVDVLARARVAAVLRQVVALAGLLGVAAPGDEVDDRAALGQLVERRELLGGHQREGRVRAQGHDRLEVLGELADRRGDDERVRGRRAVGEQRVVVAAVLERGHVAPEVGEVDAAARHRLQLGRRVEVGEADELDLPGRGGGQGGVEGRDGAQSGLRALGGGWSSRCSDARGATTAGSKTSPRCPPIGGAYASGGQFVTTVTGPVHPRE